MLRYCLALACFALPAAAQQIPAFVGSESCIECHTNQAEGWRGSDHALAWTRATPENVKADFDGTEFIHDGMTARFTIDPEGRYHVAVTENDGKTHDYRVHSVAGFEPLQQYLIETEPGRLQAFDVVWDTEKGRWFHLYPDAHLPRDDGLHWTGSYKNWNGRCAECHATDFHKNYDSASRSYASTQAEIGVGCEACHGPGAAHLDWARGMQVAFAPGLDAFGFSQSFADAEQTVEQCATCHSRREAYADASPIPGTPYAQSYRLSPLLPGLYEADGQIRDEVYVYGSFLQSTMYARGVTCLNCHDPHTARLIADGNGVCVQCHSPAGNSAFPTLRLAEYDTPSHHFHEPGSDGAQCKNCHAPEHLYMGNDWRADHAFRIPRPDLAAETGAPDACTMCHRDRDPAWAASEIASRFPQSTYRGAHFGTAFAKGKTDPLAAAADLSALASDVSRPAIVRATALWLLNAAQSQSAADNLAPLMQDANPLVRAGATELQGAADGRSKIARVAGALNDPVPEVRLAAARMLLDTPMTLLSASAQRALDHAMREWIGTLLSHLDFPETHLRLGGLALAGQDAPAAIAAFQEAVHLDPQQIDAWIMLVQINAALGNLDAARETVKRALQATARDPTLLRLQNELSSAKP